MYPDFDMCVDMNAGDPTQSDIMCGPIPSEMHRKIDAVPAVSASCFTPAAAISGLYELEFAPSGNVRAHGKYAMPLPEADGRESELAEARDGDDIIE